MDAGPLWALWLACAVYWMLAARNAKPADRRESVGSRLAHAVPLLLAVLLLVLPHTASWLDQRMWRWTAGAYWSGVAVVAAGLGFACWARLHLGRNWSGLVEVKQDHALIRSGPYRWVRHPIYTGLVLAIVGSAISRDEWRGVLAVALTLYALLRKMRLEEAWMEAQFPGEYPAYRRTVPALIPFLY